MSYTLTLFCHSETICFETSFAFQFGLRFAIVFTTETFLYSWSRQFQRLLIQLTCVYRHTNMHDSSATYLSFFC